MSLQSLARMLLVLFLAAAGGCGGSNSSGGGGTPAPNGPNVMAVTINPASSHCNAVNVLCASVTICQPGTSTCQTIPDVLVDTGSYGVRVFGALLSVSLPSETSGAVPLGECAFFGDETNWGAVKLADVVLGGEPAVQVPIQVIDPTFAGQYTADGHQIANPCGVAQVGSSPSQAGFNGILGLGLFPEDDQLYFGCNVSTCNPAAIAPAQQVQNPVPLLPVDNNGVAIQLPAVPAGGAAVLSGALILGIGTRSNNQPSGVTVYPTDGCGRFRTTYNGTLFTDGGNCTLVGGGFIDSGSNAMFFPDPTISLCPGGAFYCPSTPLNLSASNTGAGGSPVGTVTFQVANAATLFSSFNAVFNNLGGPVSGEFDYGLPFFLGRTVYVGISGRQSILGTGPYWAY